MRAIWVALLLMRVGSCEAEVGDEEEDDQCMAGSREATALDVAEPSCSLVQFLQTELATHPNRHALAESAGRERQVHRKRAKERRQSPAPARAPRLAVAMLRISPKAQASAHSKLLDGQMQQGEMQGNGVATIALVVAALSLCVVSVFLYARATFWASEEEEAAPEPAHPSSAHPAKDEADCGHASPQSQIEPVVAIKRSMSIEDLKRKSWGIDDAEETLSEFAFVLNMCADICPAGFLPLTAGLKDTGFMPAFVIIVVAYGLCVYTMYAIGRTIEITGGKDFTELWTRTFGQESSWIPVAIVVAVCFGDAIANSCFFADMLADALQISRSSCLLGFTLFPLLPLCLVKDLSSLSHTSAFACVAVLYTVAVMVVRALDGSYLPGGTHFVNLPVDMAPNVPENHLYMIGRRTLALVNCLALAFLSHYNGCKYYRELKQHTPARLAKCTAIAMGISAALFMIMMSASFETFGMVSDAVILLNYSNNDLAAKVACFAVSLSIIAAYPLVFSGLREAVIALLKHRDPLNAPGWDAIWKQDAVAMTLLATVTAIVLLVDDTSFVVGLVGAVCGITVIYILPSSLYAAAIWKYSTQDTCSIVFLAMSITGLGCLLAIAGAAEDMILG